jgi:acetyl esterase/lipase
VAPGSESWTWEEGNGDKNSAGVNCVYNVVHPSLTVFRPSSINANPTGVIVCPGGAFHFLAIDHEGTNIAKRLLDMGITVFVLKYRLVRIFSDNPFDDMLAASSPKAWDEESLPVIPLAIADARKALSWARVHAAEYNLATNQIGIIGFSAGGLVAAATAFDYSPDNCPNFVAPIYADLPGFIQSTVLPDAPPLFLACAQDDEFEFALHAINLYQKWYAAKRPAEIHLFENGRHGFGTGVPGTTSDNWMKLLEKWMSVRGLINAPK